MNKLEIMVAASAGFCFGVKRAVECVYKKLRHGNIYTYGAIIHNKEVVKDLKEKNVKITEDLESVNDGEIIIRSHGVGPDVYEDIRRRGLKFTDCTCPYVKKIHNIVSAQASTRRIIIIGDENHPEVIGINGWADNASIIIDSPAAALKCLQDEVFSSDEKYSLVVQTTFQTDIFEEINRIIGNELDIKVYNTICSATSERQKEAVNIAKKADIMIVLGDIGSSNTQKLYEISKKYCKKTFLCETISDLELNIFYSSDKIGVTAGASTPPAIIKEAVNIMSELEKESKTFEEMIDGTIVTLHTGAVVKGTVIQVSNGEVSVNLGYKADGIIPKGEFSEDPAVNPDEHVKPGDEIEVFVVRVNDVDGNVQLSRKKIEANKSFVDIEEAFNNKMPLKGKIIDIVKGGLIALIKGVRVFVPSSQISNRYVEDLTVFKGKEFDFEILEYDRSKRRIVGGRKELAQKEYTEMKNKVFDNLKVGDRVGGVVSRILDFGAFVDLGGVDGLIHISELSWGRVKKVKDVLSEGDKVVVTVLDIIKEKGKISLSLKDINSDPWTNVTEKYPVGTIVTGKVVRIVPFGAFVELEEGVDALVHISQIAYKHVVKPDDELSIGQMIDAKVTEIDQENKKISLSIKETLEKPEEKSDVEAKKTGEKETADVKSVGEVLAEDDKEPETTAVDAE